jgi:hypothetical protein
LDEADPFLARVNYLERTGRYSRLLSHLANANDAGNFLALTLEVNFAYQFESEDRELTYEVRQDADNKGSIDFLRKSPTGHDVFFEIRLLRQTQSVTNSINDQLIASDIYMLTGGGEFEQSEVIRIQSTILSKTQNRDGKPIKFFSTATGTVNIVVIDATEANLGMIDIQDCMLALHGDPSVDEPFRRQIFGLFQDNEPHYPQHIQELATKFSHVKQILHGVMFLFKTRPKRLLSYELEQYMIWNPKLMNSNLISRESVLQIENDITAAVPRRQHETND